MDLKSKPNLTRTDVAELLKSIGEPGEKRDEKYKAVQELERQNGQNIKLEDSLASYTEY